MNEADLVWNRAALKGGGPEPKEGDRALAALLLAHGLAMNGGVLHAVEGLSPDEFRAALDGYRFFGFEKVASLLEEARDAEPEDPDAEDAFETEVDRRYGEEVANDGVLVSRFEEHFAEHPEQYSPRRSAEQA